MSKCFLFAISRRMIKSHVVESQITLLVWQHSLLTEKQCTYISFQHITYIIYNCKTLNFFGPKFHGLGVRNQQKIPLELKNTAFSQIWIFVDKFELRAILTHTFFVRYRKHGLRGFRNNEKKFVQVLSKLVPRP